MASAARGESSNPYGGGLGAGGKFRNPKSRPSQRTTPYDRPKSWLSKLVDPAQRLITHSAHRLFASVFQKRLVSGDTPLQSPEQRHQLPERDVNLETKVGHTTVISNLSTKNDLIRTEDTNASADSTKDGFTDFEKILKEKTFTRSEVDRLTTLLRSKAVDSSSLNKEQRNEVSIVGHPTSNEKDRVPNNGSMNALVSTPLRSSKALDECIASPAQLAKAYMGSRPSEVTPSMLGLRGQGVREDSVFLNRTPFPPKSPTMAVVTKPSGQRPLENGFVTPRSRGRSAVYSMARTPYTRPQSTVKIGSLFQASPSTWDEGLSSGPRQGFQSGLKRRSSVLDNDIGSVGPVRRIRQKSNLSSRSLAPPASESPLSVRASGGQKYTHTSKDSAEDIPGSSFNLVPTKSSEMASKILQHLDKLVSPREKSPSKLSPSMLRGPALKSLQTLESPKFLENSPEKNANLPGPSHQKQERSRDGGSREVVALNEKNGGAVDGTRKTSSSKDQETLDKGAYLPLTSSLEEHPPKKRAFRMSAHEDLWELEDDRGAASTEEAEKQNAFKGDKGAGSSMPKGEKPLTSSEAMPSTSYVSNGDASQGTSNGFLETGSSKVAAMPTEAVQQNNMPSEPASEFIQGTEKSSIFPTKPISEEKVIPLEEPKKAATVFPNNFSSPAATDLSNQNTGASAGIKLEKTSSSAFGVSEASAKPTESKNIFSNSVSGAESTTSAASTINGSIFSAGANAPNNGSLTFPPSISNVPSDKSATEVPCAVQSFAATPTFSIVVGKLPANTSNDSKSGSNSQSTSAPPLSSTAPFKFGGTAAPFSASTASVFGGQISKETEVKNTTFGNIQFGGTASTDASTASASGGQISKETEVKNSTSGNIPFGGTTSTDASPGNVFATKSSEIKSSAAFVFGGSSLNPATAASSAPGSSGSLLSGVKFSSTPGTETSKFSGSSAATTVSNTFGAFSPAFTSSGNNMFGGVAASTGGSTFAFNAGSSASASSSQSQASNLFVATNAQTSNSGSGTTTSTQSAPFQFASSAPAPSFGLSTNTSPFGLSKPEPPVFASGSTPQLSSTNSSASSSGTTSSSLFGTNWQTPSSAPAFSTSFTATSTPTFAFGGSSAANGSSAAAPMFGGSTNTTSSSPIFGNPTNMPSSAPIFGFSSTTTTTPQQPAFGNSAPSVNPFGTSTPGFAFGVNNTNGFTNNQQVSMEDSMAEDTDQANKSPSMVSPPMFGQPPVSMAQPSFAFGGAQAATPPPSMANPFQFGGQPIAQQNASPFQASQSLEFQGGGSFSLGSTGGGDKSGRRIFKAKKTNRKK